MALSYAAHEWFGGNPADSALWLEEKIGPEMIEILREKMNSGVKVSKQEEREIARHYREQIKLMEQDPNHELESWQ